MFGFKKEEIRTEVVLTGSEAEYVRRMLFDVHEIETEIDRQEKIIEQKYEKGRIDSESYANQLSKARITRSRVNRLKEKLTR